MKLPRFHPLITTVDGGEAHWYICDRHAKVVHSLPKPYIPEPCDSYEEALELCQVLNEDNKADQ